MDFGGGPNWTGRSRALLILTSSDVPSMAAPVSARGPDCDTTASPRLLIEQSGGNGQFPQVGLRACPDMRDHLAGAEAAELGALFGRKAIGHPIEETGGEQVPRSGGVHHLVHRNRWHRQRPPCGDDHAAGRA